MTGRLDGWWRKFGTLLFVAGVLLLGVYLGARIHRRVLSRAEVQRFTSHQSVVPEPVTGSEPMAAQPDFSLWSEKRIRDYEESLAAHFSPAIAVLRIPKIQLEVPVLEGTDDVSLNRAVGLIAGTARPGESGNIGIAGHRDGFFRGLKDIAVGDVIELASQTANHTYVIDRIIIVDPSDVSVLAPRPHPSVTLVTCYPFYFVGSAPQRYIVQASLVNADPRSLQANQNSRP